MKKLLAISAELKVAKGNFNAFGKYSYRSLADINEAVKPLLVKHQAALVVTDRLIMMGDWHYIEATASLYDAETGECLASSTSYAREAESKKGMDESQITGTASSYARKYALGGLFGIDDTADADSMDNSDKGSEKPVYPEASLANNLPLWQKGIAAGKMTAASIIEKIQTTFTITAEQEEKIKGL